MAILHSCCCWNNVRTGSIASGVYTLILSLVNGGLGGYNLVLLRDRALYSEQDEVSLSQPMHSAQGWLLSTLVVCVLLFITSVLLIIALHKDKRCIFIPWMVMTLLMIAVDTAVLIYQCVVFGLLTFNIIQMVIWLGITLLNIYCVLCVISQYQELGAGRGTLEYIQQQRARIIYRPGIQQVHITPGPIVMTCPGTMTSFTQVQNNPLEGHSSVMTTVMMSPPDYHVATELPTYSSGDHEPEEESEKTPLEKTNGPPPSYQP